MVILTLDTAGEQAYKQLQNDIFKVHQQLLELDILYPHLERAKEPLLKAMKIIGVT